MNLNKVMLIGRTTEKPELKTTNTGKEVTSFSMATNQTWKDQNGEKQEKTDFHNIVVWGKQARVISQYVEKGQELYVEGKLETRSWESDDGKKNYRTEVIMDKFEFGQKPQNDRKQPEQESKVNPHYDDGKQVEYPTDEIDPDDIPF